MRTHKRASGVPPSPVTLAEWVNGGACPPEALHEAGRLHVDLTMLAPLSMKYGTDVQMDENTYDRVALNRLVVNVDSISFRWRDDPIPMSDCLNSIPLAGDDATSETENELMADAWNSIPLKDRVIRADWDDLQNWRLKRGRRNNSSQASSTHWTLVAAPPTGGRLVAGQAPPTGGRLVAGRSRPTVERHAGDRAPRPLPS